MAENEEIKAKAETAAIAARCLDDAGFAAEVLAGDRYPEVRAAIAADLAEAGAEVEGFLVGPTEGPRPVIEGNNVWPTLPRPNLQGLIAGVGGIKIIDMN